MVTIPLDVHTHLIPIKPDRLAGIKDVHWDAEKPCLNIDGRPIALPDLFSPARLIEWMDRHQIEQAYISIPPPLYRQHLDMDEARIWSTCINDGLLAISRKYDRLHALIHLPMEHPGLAIELLQIYRLKKHAGYALAAGGSKSIVYSDPVYDVLWKSLNMPGTFVFIHPGHCTDKRLQSFYLDNLLGNPHETALAATHLIFANVLARYPNIRFCLAHAGGTLPNIVGRLQQGFETRRPGIDTSCEPPMLAAKRFYCDCISHHPDALALATSVFGDDHVYFGSDWPFPMGIQEPGKTPLLLHPK